MTVKLRRVTTDELTGTEIEAVRRLLWAAFEDHDGGMTEDDWAHALGGVHVLLELDGEITGHASVVERELQVDGRPLRTGYVEAVAIDPRLQRTGLGSRLMAEIGSVIAGRFELGALATGTPGFYERLGWLRWSGPTFVRTATGLERTEEEDGGILILPTTTTPLDLDRSSSISCEWRPGDVW
jgi:aminoglycoside 2'-N-acetyltransferase I